MKPKTFSTGRVILILLVVALTIGLVSWDHDQTPGQYQKTINDTVPKSKADRDKKVRDLDDVIDELNEVDLKETLEKAKIEIENAMKQLDGDKIRLQIEKAMKDVDLEKIKTEIHESMSKMDFDKLRLDLNESLKAVDLSKLEIEIKNSMKDFNFDKIKEEMEKVKSINMKELEENMSKLRDEMKDIGPKMEKELSKAKVELEKAKVELKEFKEFVDGLDKDGLINKKEDYTIKLDNGELFINGKKASEQVYNKYRSFLEKRKKFEIKKEKDDFDLDMD